MFHVEHWCGGASAQSAQGNAAVRRRSSRGWRDPLHRLHGEEPRYLRKSVGLACREILDRLFHVEHCLGLTSVGRETAVSTEGSCRGVHRLLDPTMPRQPESSPFTIAS